MSSQECCEECCEECREEDCEECCEERCEECCVELTLSVSRISLFESPGSQLDEFGHFFAGGSRSRVQTARDEDCCEQCCEESCDEREASLQFFVARFHISLCSRHGPETPASLEERFTADCSFFYSKCKYTLGFFSWDRFLMLHADSLSLQDLRGEAPGSLECCEESCQ